MLFETIHLLNEIPDGYHRNKEKEHVTALLTNSHGGDPDSAKFAVLEDVCTGNAKFVIDDDSKLVPWEAAVSLMDDEIRERIHSEAVENYWLQQRFFDEYCAAHYEKYGKRFIVN